MYREILLPLDGSHSAEKALPHAREIGRRFGARLTLIAVVERTRARASEVTGVGETAEPQLSRDLMERYLKSIAERLAAEGLDARTEIAGDHAAEAVLDYARTHQVQLIVVAARDGSNFSAMIEAILRQSPAPVLLVPVEREEERFGSSAITL